MTYNDKFLVGVGVLLGIDLGVALGLVAGSSSAAATLLWSISSLDRMLRTLSSWLAASAAVEWTKSSRNWIGVAGAASVVGFGVERTDIQ